MGKALSPVAGALSFDRRDSGMSNPLTTYLSDHRAGAHFAIDMLERLRDANADKPLGRFAAELLPAIEEDVTVLQRIAEQFGDDTNTLKEVTAWFAEKASRVKLRLHNQGSLGTLESLEMLALGVLGKLKLWQTLSILAPAEPRLRGIDFDCLAARAKSQHDEIETYRQHAARTALTTNHS
jgi:hypothetical protein